MADSDPRLVYLDARAAYEKARAIVLKRASLVLDVGQQLQRYPDAFIEVTIEGKKSSMYSRLDLANWPSADDLQREVLAMKAAFDHCKAAWNKLSQDQRSGCSPPPQKVGGG